MFSIDRGKNTTQSPDLKDTGGFSSVSFYAMRIERFNISVLWSAIPLI